MKKFVTGMLAVCLFTGCSSAEVSSVSSQAETENVTITNDADILGVRTDFSDYKWIEGECTEVIEISLSESLKFFSQNGSGILYFGYAGCPWCERALPQLNNAARELGVTIYYIDASIVPEEETFHAICEALDSILGKDEDGNYEFLVPLVVGVKDGEITGYHVSLLDDFTIENENSQMNDTQKAELKEIFRNIILSAADDAE